MTLTEQGERIRARRRELGWSQARLALEVELAPGSGSNVSRWERGKSMPSCDNAVALAAVLGIEIPLSRDTGRPQVHATIIRGMPVRSDLGRCLGRVVGIDRRKGEAVVAHEDRYEVACRHFDRHCV